ncbi:MAG: response regulator transcription factor [Lentimicrobium sp.]|jgi:DNA-binding NarL/FixJ family response regulator|nr:response regulator transcription factor [Lentimicrobium sp.]
MPITTYILDDEVPARERLAYLITRFFNAEFELKGQSGQPTEAIDQILALSPQVLFLDVEMPGMTGLEVSGELYAKGFKGKIVFVTAFDHYAIKAIRANAFDYILKPVDVDELKLVIERFQSQEEKQFNTAIIENFELSEREIELITHLSKGLSSEEIANEMFLSRHTVDTHRRNIHTKTGTKNTVELLNLLRE